MYTKRAAAAVWAVVVLVAGLAHARTDVIRTLERNTSRLAKTRMADRTFTAIDAPGLTVYLRPRTGGDGMVHGMIGVSRGLSQRGFFLGSNGSLSPADRAELSRLIQNKAPDASSRTVVRSLVSSIQQHKARDQRLARQDPLINSVLKQAAKVTGNKDTLLWRSSRSNASLVYRPSVQVIGGETTFSRQAFFLKKGPAGLSVQPEYLDNMRSFLDRHTTP